MDVLENKLMQFFVVEAGLPSREAENILANDCPIEPGFDDRKHEAHYTAQFLIDVSMAYGKCKALGTLDYEVADSVREFLDDYKTFAITLAGGYDDQGKS